MNSTNAIELYSRIQNPIQAITEIGKFFFASNMFGCARSEQGMVLAMACLSEQKSPLEIVSRYHLLDGRLSMKSEAMLADFRTKAGGKHKLVARTPDRAEIELSIGDHSQRFCLTWADAEAEPFVRDKKGGIKTNWATPRARMQMLWARVVSDGVRAMAPEIVCGAYTPEELGDDRPDVKPLLATTVEVLPAAEPTRPEAPTAAAATAAPEEKVPAPFTASQDAGTGRLTTETVERLQEAIGEANTDKALAWMLAKPWLKDGENFSYLSARRAQSIIDRPAAFLECIK